MATVTASASRTSEFTQAHRCRHCGRAFWGSRSWPSGVTVKCPRPACGGLN